MTRIQTRIAPMTPATRMIPTIRELRREIPPGIRLEIPTIRVPLPEIRRALRREHLREIRLETLMIREHLREIPLEIRLETLMIRELLRAIPLEILRVART